MKKRLIALLLAAVMLMTLSACGGTGSEEEEPAKETAKASAADEADAEDGKEAEPSEKEEEAASEEEEASDDEEASEETEASEDEEASGDAKASEETETPKEEASKPASDWKPDGPVTILVPYEAGNINDISVRVLSQYMEKYMGQVVYIENLPGDSPATGWAALKNRDADGLTIGVVNTPTFNNTIAQGLMSYGVATFDLICNHVSESALVIVRKNDNRFRSLDDLVEYGLAHQGELVAATNGEGGFYHIATQAFAKSAHFTYGVNHQWSVQDELQVLRSGGADFCVVTVSDIADQDNDLRILGAFSDEPVKAYPDVPTLGELGYYDGALGVYRCIVAPPGTSDDVRAFYEGVFQQVMEDPGYLEASVGITTDFKNAAETAAILKSQQYFVRSINDSFWTIDVPVVEEPPVEG